VASVVHRRRRAVAAIVALIVGAALIVAATPVVAAAIVHCCCGDHEAGDDCGCPECPAGGGALPPPHTPSVRSCISSPDGPPVAPPVVTVPAAIAVASIEIVAPAERTAPPPLLDRPLDPPPSPPPRA
jgi:hypothetical protein